MQILHINISDGTIGAAIAANRLHATLNKSGHDSRLLVWQKYSSDTKTDLIEKSSLWRFLNRAAGIAMDQASLQYVFYPSSFRLLNHPWVRSANIINLHIIHGGYFSFTVLPQLSQIAPVVLTLHDMWMMTGHCAVASYVECDRWQNGCGKCPQLNDYPSIKFDTTKILWNLKEKSYRNSNIHIVCPSHWMAGQVALSPLLNRFNKSVIHNGVDTKLFSPLSKNIARSVLNIEHDATVLMFSADSLTRARKGGTDLAKSLSMLAGKFDIKPTLLLVGGGNIETLRENSNISEFQIKHIGSVNNEWLMRVCYSAADLVLLPTLADNLPSVLIESLSCGTPCISYSVGGVSEIIDHMKTGYLAKYRSIDDLTTGIALLLKDAPLRLQMSKLARDTAVNKFDVQLQAEQYVTSYKKAIGDC